MNTNVTHHRQSIFKRDDSFHVSQFHMVVFLYVNLRSTTVLPLHGMAVPFHGMAEFHGMAGSAVTRHGGAITWPGSAV